MNARRFADLARHNLSFREAFALGDAQAFNDRRVEVTSQIRVDGLSGGRVREEPEA